MILCISFPCVSRVFVATSVFIVILCELCDRILFAKEGSRSARRAHKEHYVFKK
jgi:hypothetical protein